MMQIKRDVLVVFDPSVDIAKFAFRQIWHRRRDSDPAHIWLRQMVARLLAAP